MENLENLKEQATRLQKCIGENGTLKKGFVIIKQKLESWKLIKQKKKKKRKNRSFILTTIRRFKGASQISWKWKANSEKTTG